MKNQRQNFRYRYPLIERPVARLERDGCPTGIRADVLDLGVEGMGVSLEAGAPSLQMDETIRVHLELPRLEEPLAISCAVVYLERVGANLRCGLRFLPLLVPAATTMRERTLWRYLREEERRGRKKGRSSGVHLRLYLGK
jgi:hypothetical protein